MPAVWSVSKRTNSQTHKQINTDHHIEMPIRWGKYYAIPRYYSTIYIFQVLDP